MPTTAQRTRRKGLNRSGRCCRCVVVVQNGLPWCGSPLALTQYRRAAGTPDREVHWDPSEGLTRDGARPICVHLRPSAVEPSRRVPQAGPFRRSTLRRSGRKRQLTLHALQDAPAPRVGSLPGSPQWPASSDPRFSAAPRPSPDRSSCPPVRTGLRPPGRRRNDCQPRRNGRDVRD